MIKQDKEPMYQSGREKKLYFNGEQITRKEFKELKRSRDIFRMIIILFSFLFSLFIGNYGPFGLALILMLCWRIRRGF